ncbi:hypothetical protein ANN_06919 [Periplaneta americana]|uniref:DDE Tnp4 domain-containing protein n=1 Tax=Periplaneta americana TaxID=6978 RepID=A0ABQ8TFR1_PERAM|nr:hypothetical protein ANN_06919 [Periplaneta americana]
MADAESRFLAVDVGDLRRNSDGGVFSNSDFGKQFFNNTLNLPPPRTIDGKEFPIVFVADQVYSLTTQIMRPFSRNALTNDRRIYNYRHSRAKIVECAFGILTKKFRCSKVQSLFLLKRPQLSRWLDKRQRSFGRDTWIPTSAQWCYYI